MASSESRLRHLVRKHDRWLTVAGTFIVFMTFVVKERLGDQWRETASAIQTAQDAVATNSSFKSLNAKLDEISRSLHELRGDRLGDRLDLGTDTESFTLRIEADDLTLDRAHADLKVIMPIVDRLAEEGARSAEFDNLLDNIGWAYEERNSLELSAPSKELAVVSRDYPQYSSWNYRRDGYKTSGRSPIKAMMDSVMQREDAFGRSVIYLSQDVSLFTRDTIFLGMDLRSRNEKRAKYASWITIGLFVVGWSLGLVGKIYGVSGSATGE